LTPGERARRPHFFQDQNMTDPDQIVASLAGVSLSLGDWLASLKRRGRLLPLLREAVVERFLLECASQTGLTVSPEELQQAANAFRRQHGLTSAEQAHTWLAGQHLSTLDFEDALERDLLIEKLKDHLTRDRIAAHFAANQAGYGRARLRLLLVAREDLARELLTQFHEGRDFAELARAHSAHPSRDHGGQVGWMMRHQLPGVTADPVFAAREGEVVGPLPTPQGFQLFLVEALLPAELDANLTNLIRQELFDAWLQERLAGCKLELPLLEAL
jgi:parvulin-like peptidyl-prolyl isomerase